MDRRTFLGLGVAALPGLTGVSLAPRRSPLVLATADTEAHVVVVSLASGRVVQRLHTAADPRSIESGPGGHVVVAHSAIGALSLLTLHPARVRRVLRGWGAPRYTAIAPDGAHAFVTDGERGELVVVDLRRARIVGGVEIGAGARHVALDPTARTVWAALGSSAATIAVVDVSEPRRPRLRRRVHPPFLAHDVAFSPSGRRVWVTSGRVPRIALLPAGEAGRPVLLDADAAPQHVAFARGAAFVASGDGASLRTHDLADGRLRHAVRVPFGSYNVTARAGGVATPSLASGRLTILDGAGNVRRQIKIAQAAHDACIVG
jgi:DNA-binding beta-propeller fold protein YncE